jgi:hypothetical protein
MLRARHDDRRHQQALPFGLSRIDTTHLAPRTHAQCTAHSTYVIVDSGGEQSKMGETIYPPTTKNDGTMME